MRVLVDTSAYYAGLSSADACHEAARATYTGLLRQGSQLLTTSYVLGETAGLVQRRLGIPALGALMAGWKATTTVLWVDEELHSEAWETVRKLGRREVSLVDASVAVAARRLHVTHVFAYDPHFAEWGLKVIG